MFTVCPKCALTLVVTAQDLRVAQGYVRCGRCSNVFNAIVGLTDDRGALAAAAGATAGGSTSPGTASTSIMRKAPSLDDAVSGDAPADPLADTGETEAVYAEPDADEVRFQEVFIEPPPPPSTPTRGPVKFVAPPPGPPPRAIQEPKRTLDPEKRYSDTEGIETYPEHELEFNPNVTDVTKVFVEAAPVTFRNNAATGQFEKIVLGADGELARPVAPSASQPARQPASQTSTQKTIASPSPTTNQTAPQAARPAPAPSPAPKPTPPAPAASPPAQPSASPVAKAPPAPVPQPDRVDVTASRPAAKFQAANDEEIESETGANTRFVEADDEDEIGLGDIYAKAKPRPPAPRNPPADTGRNTGNRRTGSFTNGGSTAAMALPNDAEMAIGPVDQIAAEPGPRNRFMLWVAGASVLSVFLVVQAIHHNRHDLATNAFLNRPLTKLYGALGIPLVPNWDLTKYDVRQLGASTSEVSQGTLTVRASLKNTATQPLPLPLLRIVMQDRYGNRVATRDVPPTGYVPGAVPAEAHLGVGQRIDAEMTFKDPGQDAVGFEIDACLPTASGRIACANDAAVASR